MIWSQLLNAQRFDGKSPQEGTRSVFEQDYDRIIFSYPFRRLQDKTQVFPLPKEDFVHTRLTHSLEVSSVGRSLGKRVGEELCKRHPELAEIGISASDFGGIVAAAALAHDLGNPPFGHCGESAISDFFQHTETGAALKQHCSEAEWADLINFEGNAQGFRILNHTRYTGLQLTYATLAAFTKYPCAAHLSQRNKALASQKKYGFYQSEQALFTRIAEATGLPLHAKAGGPAWSRHPLAFLVEAADDICYHLIDLEDGCRMGLLTYADALALLEPLLQEQFMPEKLLKIKSQNERMAVLRAVAIGRLIDQSVALFLDCEEGLLRGDFERALTDEIPAAAALKEIKKVSIERIYRSQPVLETEIAGFEVLGGLLEAFLQAGYSKFFDPSAHTARHRSTWLLLPEDFRPTAPESAYSLAREVLDYVSGLTDSHAVALYRRLVGTSLPVLR
jgi:dGTPase